MQERTYEVEFVCANPKCGNVSMMTLETVGGKEIDRGCLKSVICEKCEVKEREESKNRHEIDEKNSKLERSGFPIDKINAWSFSDARRNAELEDWIKDNRNSALWISGYPQIGKTFAVLKVAREEVERGRFVRWVHGDDLFGGYVDAMRESSAKAAAYIRGMLACDLLVIDDIDAPGRFTHTAGQLVYKLLDGIKNDNSKRIWVTANLHRGELRKMFESGNHAAKVEERVKGRFLVWAPAR